jgi:uncharacterized caspase-like protein
MSRRCTGRILLGLALAGFAAWPNSAPAGDRPRGEKFALLVGVGEYEPTEFHNLPYAEADVADLAQVLRGSGYAEDNIVLMTTASKRARFHPLAANVRKELRLLLEDRTADDTVLVALAGHGVQFRGKDENYFCPMDARVADVGTLLSLGELYKDLEGCKAGVKLLLVDACRNDPLARAGRGRETVALASSTRPQEVAPPGGVAAFFSCSAGEQAFEHKDLGHGIFFHFVIEGLRGAAAAEEGEVTLPDLEGYVKRQVSRYVRTQFGVRQMPELVGKTRGLVPLATVAPRSRARPDGVEQILARAVQAHGGTDKLRKNAVSVTTTRGTVNFFGTWAPCTGEVALQGDD